MDQQPYGSVKINRSSIVRGMVIAVFIILFFLALGWLLQSGWFNGGGDSDDESSLQTNVPDGLGGSNVAEQTLTVNSKLLAKGGFFLSPSPQPANPQAGQMLFNSQTNTLQYYNGTEFVDLVEGVTTIGGASGTIVVGDGLTVSDGVLSSTVTGGQNFVAGNGITINGSTLNNTGVIAINGTADQVNVNTNNGTVTLSLPQSIGITSTPTFAGINLGTALSVPNGGTGVTSLTPNGVLLGNGTGPITSVASVVPGECLISTAGAPVWQACPGGGGGGAPTNATYLLVSNDPSLTADRALAAGSNISFSDGGANSSFTVNVVANPTFNTLTLTSPLAVASGGTGASSLAANGILMGNGVGAVTSITSGGAGLCLVSTAGAPTFQACPGSGGVTSVNGLNGILTIQGTTNQVNVASGGTTITLSTPQDIATTSSPTFAGLTLSSPLTVANGGTGAASHTAGGILFGNGTGAFTNSGVLTNGQLLIGDGAGAPTAATLTQGTGIAITNGAGSILVDVDGTVCRTSGNCAGVGGTGDILQGGNSFTTAMTIGTNDAFDLNLETSGLARLTIGSAGDVTIANNASVNGNTTLGNTVTDNLTLTGAIQGANALIFDGATDDTNEITLAITDPGADFTITVPAATGTLCLTTGNCAGIGGTGDILNNGQNGTVRVGSNDANSVILESNNVDRLTITSTGAATFSGSLTVTGLTTVNGGLTIEIGDTLTFNGDAFTDLTGTGLIVSTGSLQTTLGTSVDLTSEVTGILPIANGGTNASTAQGAINNISGLTTNGDLLYHNGTNTTRLARGSDGQCLLSNTTTILWTTCTGDGTGATTIGALDGGTANANGATITGTTLFLQSASASSPGLVNTTTQTFAGDKTFDNNLTVNGSLLWVGPGTGGAAIALSPSATGSSTVDFNNLSGTDHITFDNSTDTFTWKAAGVDQLTVSGSGLTVLGNTTIGDSAGDLLTVNAVLQGTNALVFEGATADTFETIFAVTDPTADQTITLPNASGVVCLSSGNCAGGAGGSKWTDAGTQTYLTSTTDELVVGGSLSLGAKLAVVGTSNQEQLLIRAYSSQTNANPLILFQNSAGSEIGRLNVDGSNNIALGLSALQSNTSGTGNIGIGQNALQDNTTGVSNVAIGNDAQSNATGSYNVGLGQITLQDVTGNENAALGHRALSSLQGGSSNVGVGGQALLSLVSGDGNIGIGFQVGDNLTSGTNNILIGNGVDAPSATGSNQLNIGNVLRGDTSIGSALFRNTTNSTTAFQVQNSTGNNLFQVDTTGPGGLTLLGNNSGETSAWTTNSTTLPTVNDGAAIVAANGFVYVAGGYDGAMKDEVYYAKLNADGSVGSWTATTSLPVATGGTTGATANGYIYVLGGVTGSATNDTYYAKLNADGSVGSWTQGTDLSFSTYNHRAITHKGYIYAVGGNGNNTVGYARLNADGSMGSWSTTTSLPTSPVDANEAVGLGIANGRLYATGGGADNNNPSNIIQYATINADGTLGSWTQSGNTMPASRMEHTTVISNGYIYVIGGHTGTSTTHDDIFYTKLNADGTVGTWSTSANVLPAGRRVAGSVIANGFAYVLGGAADATTQTNTIYYARISGVVQVGGNLDLVGLQGANLADAGNSYLGSTGGSITAGNGTFVGSLQVQGYAQFAQSASVGGDFNVKGTATFQNSVNSTNAFQVQNSTGNNLFQVDSTDAGSITLLGNNSGDTSNWQSTTGLPGGRHNPASVSANGYIYVIGGYNFGAQTSVYYGKVNTDGSVSSWDSATSLPGGRAYASATYANGYIYLVGGSDDFGSTNHATVYYAKTNSDGSLDAWNSTTSLPADRAKHTSFIYNGYIYTIGGSPDGGTSQTTVYYARMNPDGSVGSWSTTTALPSARSRHGMAIANGYVYVVGGHDGSSNTTDTTYYAKINGDGTFSSWTSASSTLPSTLACGSSVVNNGYLYFIGGQNSSDCNSGDNYDIYYAKTNADGSIGAWSTSSNSYNLSPRPSDHTSVITNGYAYVIAGSSATDRVTYARFGSRVTIGGDLDLVGLQGANLADTGNGYLGSSGGSITAGNGTFVGALQVQGDVSFGSSLGVKGSLTVQSSAALHGDLLAVNKLSSTTATTSGTGTNVTTLTFTGTTSFANNDVLYIDNAGQDFVTRIVSGGNAASVTVSPAVTFENARTVTKYESLQNIGASTTDYTNLNNRFFQGYFLGGIVAGTGSTLYGDQKIASTGDLAITATATSIKSTSNSATAFQVQSSSGSTVLNVNTLNSRVEVGGDIYSKGLSWTSRTSAADNFWGGVTYGNGLFVAVGSSGAGNRVMTSPDGVNWTVRTSAADNSWTSVTYGNGLFVAVASTGNNRVMTSPDGINWTIRTSASSNQWRSVTYGNGLFVALSGDGTNNQVMTSPDGITWTSRTTPVNLVWSDVVYGNNMFVAVAQSGTGNRVMTSPDGITWTSRTSAADNWWFDVTYGNGLFVAVAGSGTGNRVMTSPDGITWTSRTTPVDISWQSIAYGNGLFVAVAGSGTGNRVMTSPDGITWTIRTSAADNTWQETTYGNGIFVSVSADGTGNRVMTSGRAEVSSISANNTYQGGLIVNNGGTFSASVDGWTTRTSAADNGWNSVAYGNSTFVAVSAGAIGTAVMTSPDGITWTSRTAAVANGWSSVTYGEGLFVAVSNSGTGNRVMTSPDGITWTSRTSAADNSWSSVTYGNGVFVAVAASGTGNRVMTSPDGITWTSRTSAADNNWTSVAYSNGRFVAVASSGTGNRVMSSPDGGITWDAHTSAADNSWLEVTYGNGLFVAVAASGTGNRVMTSPDGITWTSRTSAADNDWVSVTYGNGLYVAVAATGTNSRIMTSPNGITWTTRINPVDNDWNSIVYNGTLFVAVSGTGTGNRVMTSTGKLASITSAGLVVLQDSLNVTGPATFGSTISYVSGNSDTNNTVCRNSLGQLSACTSSQRYKSDVADLTLGLDDLRLLQPVSYTWNTTGQQDVGFIAEEVAAIIPQAVTYNENGEVASFNPHVITALLVASVQDLDLQVQDIEDRLTQLELGNFDGNVQVSGGLKVSGITELATLRVNGKIITAGETPTISSPNGSATVSGNDVAGTVSYTAGSNATGSQMSIIFHAAYAAQPRVTLTPTNAGAASVRFFVDRTATGFTISFIDPPASGTSYTFDYQILQ